MKNLNNKTNKTNKVESSNVKEVKEVKEILSFDLDDKNLNSLLNKLSTKKLNDKKESLGKRELYKKSIKDFEKDSEYKSYKRKMRKQLESFCNNIQFYFLNKDLENLKLTIDRFNKFYKENYILNDLSEESLRFNNADESTKENIKDTLMILKSIKK